MNGNQVNIEKKRTNFNRKYLYKSVEAEKCMQLIVEALELGQEDLKQNPKKKRRAAKPNTRPKGRRTESRTLIINSLLDAFLNRKHFWNAIFWQSPIWWTAIGSEGCRNYGSICRESRSSKSFPTWNRTVYSYFGDLCLHTKLEPFWYRSPRFTQLHLFPMLFTHIVWCTCVMNCVRDFSLQFK